MRDRFSQAYLWYVVAVLTIASTFSIIDRQILNVMIGPVKRDLGGISDFQVSLIMGFAFTFLYSVLSYPAGWVADRYNRKNLMAVGIAAWSAMTMLCGMVSQYWHLFATRMGVGVGEATLQPAATSSLSDYFPPHMLPLAMGIVASAPFIGQGLANIASRPDTASRLKRPACRSARSGPSSRIGGLSSSWSSPPTCAWLPRAGHFSPGSWSSTCATTSGRARRSD